MNSVCAFYGKCALLKNENAIFTFTFFFHLEFHPHIGKFLIRAALISISSLRFLRTSVSQPKETEWDNNIGTTHFWNNSCKWALKVTWAWKRNCSVPVMNSMLGCLLHIRTGPTWMGGWAKQLDQPISGDEFGHRSFHEHSPRFFCYSLVLTLGSYCIL